MKKVILLSAIITLLIGCKGNKTIEFCEGISTKGEGVKCGNKFSTGELTALIKPGSNFNVNKITINIFKKGKYKTEKIDTILIEVKPEENLAKANFYFYDDGDYLLEAIGQENKKIAEGSISIIESY